MSAPTIIYYDGGCPVCSKEIAFYRARPGTVGFQWVDVSQAGASELGPDLTRTDAMARMHVRNPNGALVNGAAAFAAMWRQMPGFKWLGWLLSLPLLSSVAEGAYRCFLISRKIWR